MYAEVTCTFSTARTLRNSFVVNYGEETLPAAQEGIMAMRAFVLTAAMSLVGVNHAGATLVFNFSEVAGDVQLVVSGSFDLNATLGFCCAGSNVDQVIVPSFGDVLAGDAVVADAYTVNSSFTPFGPGYVTNFDSTSGDRVALYSDLHIGFPVGYVSGAPLSAKGTIVGETFASLGMTPGTWVTHLGSGEFSDDVVVNVASEVPEPTTLLLLGAGLGTIAARRRLRRGGV